MIKYTILDTGRQLEFFSQNARSLKVKKKFEIDPKIERTI